MQLYYGIMPMGRRLLVYAGGQVDWMGLEVISERKKKAAVRSVVPHQFISIRQQTRTAEYHTFQSICDSCSIVPRAQITRLVLELYSGRDGKPAARAVSWWSRINLPRAAS
jgi:hypothetical protein